MRRPWRALPLHVVNGLGVAVGVAAIHALMALLTGSPTAPAAVWAVSGAVCVSLADVPVVPRRTWRRVSLAALSVVVVTVLVAALRTHPVALGATVAGVAFVSAMTLAWGVRAGPVSFVGLLALVFALSSPPPADAAAIARHGAWTAVGALAYLGWSLATAVLLQRRYRALALAGVMEGLAAMLRARAALLVPPPGRPAAGTDDPQAQRLRAWIRDEVTLNDRVQTARDLVFEQPDRDAETRRLAGLLMLAVDLRDTLLASELDLGLLGDDALAGAVRGRLAENLAAQAEALDAIQQALRAGATPAVGPGQGDDRPLHAWVARQAVADGDPRARLLPALADRGQHMIDDLRQMQALVRGDLLPLRLTRDEMALFVSPEGWPLAGLRAQARLRSPVLRHALRSAVALTAAYVIGTLLPWASHPHWMVLSVAVVLRGNLEQTLSRRNARVLGTVLGCLLVLAMARWRVEAVASTVFLVAVGVAHAFVNVRYLVTAIAATVMALLQAHLADPSAGFAVAERLADTALGAGLAWAFCFVLPSWERAGLARTLDRLLAALDRLAGEVLTWPQPGRGNVALGMARREAYESLAALAAAAQRSTVEPSRVRMPLQAATEVLTHGQEMLGHLAAMRQMMTRRAEALERGPADAVLRHAAAAVSQALAVGPAAPPPADAATTAPVVPAAATPDHAALPHEAAAVALLPWFERRAQLLVRAADGVAAASRRLRPAPRARGAGTPRG